MVTIYANLNCPHCAKVIEALHHDIGIDFDVRYIKNPEHAAIVEAGGKLQAPYMVDDSNDMKMYESDDIIKYLTDTYKK